MIVFCAKVKKTNFEFYFWNVKEKILGSIGKYFSTNNR